MYIVNQIIFIIVRFGVIFNTKRAKQGVSRFPIYRLPTILCFVRASYPLFCAGVVLCLFCGSLDFSLPVRLCQTSSVTIGQPAEYSILMQNSGKDNARFCFSCKDDWLC